MFVLSIVAIVLLGFGTVVLIITSDTELAIEPLQIQDDIPVEPTFGQEIKVPSRHVVNEDRGSTNGNVLSGGRIVQREEYIYVIETYASGGDGGAEVNRLTRHNQHLGEKDVLLTSIYALEHLNVMDNYIVLSIGRVFHKMNRDGTDIQPIFDEGVPQGNGWIAHLVNDWLIWDYRHTINRAHINGNYHSVIVQDDNAFRSINIYENWIFYASLNDHGKWLIYSIHIDGAGKSQVSELYVFPQFIVDGGWIYFTVEPDAHSAGTYKMRLDGTDIRQINSKFTMIHNVLNGWLYYESIGDDAGFYRVLVADGKKEKLIDTSLVQGMVFPIGFTDTWFSWQNFLGLKQGVILLD